VQWGEPAAGTPEQGNDAVIPRCARRASRDKFRPQWLGVSVRIFAILGSGRIGARVAGSRSRASVFDHETVQGESSPMTNALATPAYESATDWNRRHPPGTPVRIVLTGGAVIEASTASCAQQWGAFAVLTLRGHAGLWTTAALEPRAPGECQ
jgi:hypothetical protein